MNKNTHLEHPEDLMLQQGLVGMRNILSYFEALVQWLYGDKKNLHITVKYDGAPAVVFGSHPINGELFVSTKSFFNKNPLIATNSDEIMKYFNKDGKGPYKPLLALLHALESEGVEQVGIFQGDILYTPETLGETETHYEIKHNTLTYKVDKNSSFGKRIAKCSVGLVVHTEYSSNELNQFDASFEPQFERVLNMLLEPTIWHPPLQPFAPTTIKHFTAIESIVHTLAILTKKSKKLPDLHKLIQDNFKNTKIWFEKLQRIINRYIRETKELPSAESIWEAWKDAMNKSFTEKKNHKAINPTNPVMIDYFDNTYHKKIITWLQWYIDAATCKDNIVTLLHSLVDHPGLEVYINDIPSTHEGFVVSNISDQWVIKLVKRSEFSHANFTIEKPWEKK